MRNGENGLIKSRPLYITTSLVLLVVLIFSLLLAVTFGSVRIPLRDVYGVILYKLAGIGDASVYGSGKIRDVVWIIRLPRLLLSMVSLNQQFLPEGYPTVPGHFHREAHSAQH